MSTDDFTRSTISKKMLRLFNSLYLAIRYWNWSLKNFTIVTGFVLAVFTLLLSYHMIYNVELLPWHPSVDHWCDNEDVPEYMVRPTVDEMTVVTMFLDLGVFQKGEETLSFHTPYKYRRWMRVFSKMVNRVVAYIENDEDINYFREIRSCLPPSLTKIVKVYRHELSSFKHLQQIATIYSRPSYPKHHPNTVYPEYSCAMNAKYDVLQRSCMADFFKTPYFAWLDIGLFRHMEESNYGLFKLVPPAKFNPESIGFSQAWPQNPVYPVESIIKNKIVWVSGSMVLATKEYMLNFTRDYQDAVKELLDQGLSNTDQEVIYAMYSVNMRKPHYIKIKTYLCHQGQLGLWGAASRYFCLGYVCKDAWEKRVPHIRKVKGKT